MVYFQSPDYSRLCEAILCEGEVASGVTWRAVCRSSCLQFTRFKPQSELADVGYSCSNIQASSKGRVFVACRGLVAMLEISETGNLTFSRNLTAGGRLGGGWNTVAVGSRPGQLWVGNSRLRSHYIYLLAVDNDTVIQEIQVAVDSNWSLHLYASQLLTGELLITGCRFSSKYSIAHLYQSNIT